MESGDEECFCSNCKRHISLANFASHSAFCERFIFVCKICEEPVQKSEKDKHLEEYHVTSPCNLCNAPIEKWMLPKHMELCPKRLATCKYCDADFPVNEHSEHVEFCGSRTEKCLLCQKYIMMKEKDRHTELHKLEKQLRVKSMEDEVKQNKVNEAVCTKDSNERISEKLHTSEKQVCARNIGNEIKQNKVNETVCRKDIAEKFSKHYTQCHICKQSIAWIDFNTHVPNCASSAGKCSLCGEDVPSHAFKEHMKKHTESRLDSQSFRVSCDNSSYETSFRNNQSDAAKSNIHDATFTCPYCSEHYTKDQILEHTRKCPQNLYECPLCCEKIPEKDKQRHEKDECKMIKNNDESNRFKHTRKCPQNLYECPLCREKIPEKDKQRHEKSECKIIKNNDESNRLNLARHFQNCFQCPLCFKQIPEEDTAMHMTVQCEQLLCVGGTHGLYAAGEESFQCPYCSENMPQKDKAMHVSFYCKVLLENCGIKDSYADVTKKTSYSNYKKDQSNETCPVCKNSFSKEIISEHKNKCHRLKELCPFCDQVIDISCEDIHRKFCPGIDNRDYSDPKTTAQDSRLPNKHKGAIPKNSNIQNMMKPRSAKCKHCYTPYNVDILPNHEKECIHMPVYCKFCDSQILLKDMDSHKCKWRKGRNQKMQLQMSKGNDHSFWSRTVNFFTSKDEKKVNSKQVSMQPTYSNESYGYVPGGFKSNEKLYFDRTDDTLLPCEFCQQEFPASELVLHETGCQPDLVSYAKPDLPEKSVPVSTFQNVHVAGGIDHPFFSKSNAVLTHDTSENTDRDGKLNDKIGELPQSCYNKNSSNPLENSQKDENNGVEKKPLNFHSVWNVENASDFRNDHLKDVLTEETSNLVEKDKTKELDEQAAENHPSSDNEMKTVFKFLNNERNSESDEEFVSLSDENGEQENSEMRANFPMNSKNDIQEKEGDSLLPKKITSKEKSEEVYEKILKSGSEAEKKTEKYLKLLADFGIGFHNITFPSGDNEHLDKQSEKKYEELEDASKFNLGSKNQKEYICNKKNWEGLKLGRFESVAFPGDANMNEMSKEEPEKRFKQKASNFTENCNDQRNYSKKLTNESTFLSFEENAYCPIQAAKNYELDRLHEKNILKSDYIANDAKENSSYSTYLKNNTDVSTVLSNELEHFKVLAEKPNAEPKEKYNQNYSRCFGTAKNDMEYSRDFRKYLPDFRYSFPETVRKSSQDNVTDTTLPECRSGHNVDQAFFIEPAVSQNDSKINLNTVLKTGVKELGLEEKIAALQRDKKRLSFEANEKKDDITKWKKWRKKEPSDISDSD